MDESKKIGYVEGLARSYIIASVLNLDKGNYAVGRNFLMLAKPYCWSLQKIKPRITVIWCSNMGSYFGNMGDYDSSVFYYSKALSLYQNSNLIDTITLLNLYSNLGGKLVTENNFVQGKFYIDKAFEIYNNGHINNNRTLGKLYIDLSYYYGYQKNHQLCIEYAQKAISVIKLESESMMLIDGFWLIGDTYLELKKTKEAIPYFQKILADSIHAPVMNKAKALQGLGGCFLLDKNYKKATYYFLLAKDIYQQSQNEKLLLECYLSLVETYAIQNDFQTAFQYQKLYQKLKDSTTIVQRTRDVNQLEIKYRSSEKDKEIVNQQLLLEKNQYLIRRKNLWIISGLTLTLLLIGFLLALYKIRENKERLRLMTIERDRELSQLKARMEGEEKERERIAHELHDGIMVQFASVSMNLGALMEKSGLSQSLEFEDILSQLDNATIDLRKSAHNLMPDILLREGLAEATHYFCKNLQRSAKANIDFQLIGEMPKIASEYELMLYRIIQELLQNAVKYANANDILVQINCLDYMLSIVVEDNGNGIDIVNSDSKGIGLSGIEKRIKSLNGVFHISSKENKGTSVYFELETQYLQNTTTPYHAN
jgi:signal transduction histidine kinase